MAGDTRTGTAQITEHGHRTVVITPDTATIGHLVDGHLHACYGPALVQLQSHGGGLPWWAVIINEQPEAEGLGPANWYYEGALVCSIAPDPLDGGWVVTWFDVGDEEGPPVLSVACRPHYPPLIYDRSPRPPS